MKPHLEHRIDKQCASGRDVVVLLHGLFATGRSMRLLEAHIREDGFDVLNWQYPSFLRSTESLATRMLKPLADLQQDETVATIHFVTHSLGGIIVRCLLRWGDFSKVHRIVMLAPPNRGSHLTRLSLGPFKWCVPAIADLTEEAEGLPRSLPQQEDVEVGIIAASRDRIVRMANTMLPEQRDHCTVSTTHFQMPTNQHAIRHARDFLKQGKFDRAGNDLRLRPAA